MITLFLAGDIMTGRGIDQILPHPGDPALHEPYVQSARGYVEMAELRNGPIARPVAFSYIWGDALAQLDRMSPDVRIVNLETAVTRSNQYDRAKDIHYRMHPDNLPCLTAARIDCCVLANNHVLDWGEAGLEETLRSLTAARIATAGAGARASAAASPAVLATPKKGVIAVYGFGLESSGIPRQWAASMERPGVQLLDELSEARARELGERLRRTGRTGTIAIASIHWGGNWGYDVPSPQREFAHRLVEAGFDLVHGHSSHHPKGIEVYRGRPILYGCGDLLNDYEGIGGDDEYPTDLGLLYFPTIDPRSGRLLRFDIRATRIRRFRLERASADETRRLADILTREGAGLGTRVNLGEDGALTLEWRSEWPARGSAS